MFNRSLLLLLSCFVVVFASPAHPEPQGGFSGAYYGFLLARQQDKVWMAYVEPDSPAFRAGLRDGVEITSIAGKPVAELDIGQLRTLLKEYEGREVGFGTRQARGAKAVSFQLDVIKPANAGAALAKLDELAATASYGMSDEEKVELFILGGMALIGWLVNRNNISVACRHPCDECDRYERTADCAECNRCIAKRTK